MAAGETVWARDNTVQGGVVTLSKHRVVKIKDHAFDAWRTVAVQLFLDDEISAL